MARPRKDVMKPQPMSYGEPVKPEGGMAHSVENKGDMWGGKKPPLPRSALNSTQHTMRSGMMLVK
jgi:hypothetical protein